jgi:cell shape-determining protein MreC
MVWSVRQPADRMELMPPNIKKILIVGVVALVLFFLISQPEQSAQAVRTALGWLREGAEAIVTFVQSLFA